ncbi:methyltransferase domain-containing protein [Marivita sp. S6314]|uniref:methyltransferase domain-containing protein n=1 Tax=Marivita sp. S6314 TaxID=2926406 RepID=UPI001FF2B93A|nr:methyltransferase domain-containing protein [Marivita sp. S6314]MCK0149394.1 methyltransferase domain-containing protein [Marivita sp. S6314]
MQTTSLEATEASAAEQELERARTLLKDGDKAAAAKICETYIKQDLSVSEACVLSVLLRELGQTDAADTVRNTLINAVQTQAQTDPDLPNTFVAGAEILVALEAFDEAVALCKLAYDRAPDVEEVMNTYVSLLINLERLTDAQQVVTDYCNRNGDKFNVLLHMATIFSHLGERDYALELLKRAETQCKDKTEKAKIDYLRAANGVRVPGLDQHGMAVSIFDGFADSYDEKLEVLENNGPAMVFAALQELKLPEKKTRRILDAGCGTGLCAGFLRRYAKHLMGVDISVAMLEKSRARKVYDLLARTDLSIRATYPEGRYDMVVCADVLVYFGALDTVFTNFFDILTPGGWLVFTVEDESDTAFRTGFKLYPSGRHKHSEPYLLETLSRVGFPKPKLLRRARLRNEMQKPVMGTVVAVQKPALSFG